MIYAKISLPTKLAEVISNCRTDGGETYLRKILVHGARAAVLRIKRDQTPIGPWRDALEARAPKNVAAVAMANKLARIAWAVLSSGEDYRPTSNAVAA